MQSKDHFSIIKIYLRLHNGNGCFVMLSNKSTVMDLINLGCQKNFEIPPQYNIIFKGKPITNHSASLLQLKIQNDSIVHIENNAENCRVSNIDVSIYHNFQKFIIKESSKSTIASLKLRIFKLLKVPPKNQQLIFKGIRLENDKLLEFYKITNDSLLCLLTLGGSQIEDSSKKQTGEYLYTLFDQNQLIDSVSSLRQKVTPSKIKLFRSQSIDKKKKEQQCIEVTHQQRPVDQQQQSPQFYFNLFSQQEGQLKAPVLHSSDLFASLQNDEQQDDSQDQISQEEVDEIATNHKDKIPIKLAESITEGEMKGLLGH